MAYTQAVRRGDIYYINNDRGQIGSEMKKDRPAVVVSNDMNNRYSNEITVVFLTSKPKKNLETHVTVYSTGRESVALCEGMTTLDKQRGGGNMMVDERASPKDWKEEAIRETAKAETYRAMYETLLNKIIQGGQTDV